MEGYFIGAQKDETDLSSYVSHRGSIAGSILLQGTTVPVSVYGPGNLNDFSWAILTSSQVYSQSAIIFCDGYQYDCSLYGSLEYAGASPSNAVYTLIWKPNNEIQLTHIQSGIHSYTVCKTACVAQFFY